jgi:hypothetical protein
MHERVQESPKNRKISSAIRQPIAIFRVVLFPVGRRTTVPNAVPQFAQNLAVSGLVRPQFEHVILKTNVTALA